MRRFVLVAAVFLVSAAGLFAHVSFHREIPAQLERARSFPPEMIQQGEKLAHLGACATCHTRPGGATYTGGLGLHTPFGTIYSTNITPHAESGIGLWNEEAFIRAMREGVDRRGRLLYPAFPYDHYTKVRDADLKALYAYFMTREPLRADAKDNELRFPFNFRPLIGMWNLLFLDRAPFRPDLTKSAAWNEGAYYVEGLGHCGACHSPRNALGGIVASLRLAGGDVDGWHAPGIGAHAKPMIAWTKDSLMNYLVDGWDEHHGVAAGPMTAVVNHLAKLDESMVEAMAAYLADVQPKSAQGSREATLSQAREREALGGASAGASVSASNDGPAIFARSCANCHQRNSKTVPLALGAAVNAPHAGNLIAIILNGIQPPTGVPEKSMPRFAQSLNDDQIVALVSWMRKDFTQKSDWPDVAPKVKEMRALR
jgi:mono/diheme cytochrome c family protein